jgi:predicted hydrolase (HD superfamily)
VRKKFKSKGFAAAVRREDMIAGAADLGIELDEHIQTVIDAMLSISAELDLSGAPPAA